MDVSAHGIDLVECDRIREVMTRHPDRFIDRVLTDAEQERMRQHRDPVPFVAGRWAAKEAILKMLGTGWRGLIAWRDIEILPDGLGAPQVRLTGETARIAREKNIQSVLLSITHTQQYAAASALGGR